jgi:hypothetical protein
LLNLDVLPALDLTFLATEQNAKPIKTIEVFRDCGFVMSTSFKLCGNLFDCPFASTGTKEIANSCELFFGLFGKGLLLGRNHGFFSFGNAF